jgi:hypothetical protein
VLDHPWFGHSYPSATLCALLIRDADEEFKNRNLFTTSEITWKPRRGRPRKSEAARRETTRLRVQRWRQRRRSTAGLERRDQECGRPLLTT